MVVVIVGVPLATVVVMAIVNINVLARDGAVILVLAARCYIVTVGDGRRPITSSGGLGHLQFEAWDGGIPSSVLVPLYDLRGLGEGSVILTTSN